MPGFSKKFLDHYGPMAGALVAEADEGNGTVGSFRQTIATATGIDNQGTAGFWGAGEDSNRYVYRSEDEGPGVHNWQPASVTKRCRAIAAAYQELHGEATPDEQFWLDLADHFDEISELIREKFAA